MNELMQKLDETYQGKRVRAKDQLNGALRVFLVNNVGNSEMNKLYNVCDTAEKLGFKTRTYGTKIEVKLGTWSVFGIGFEEIDSKHHIDTITRRVVFEGASRENELLVVMYKGNEKHVLQSSGKEKIPSYFYELNEEEMKNRLEKILIENRDEIKRVYEECSMLLKEQLSGLIMEEEMKYTYLREYTQLWSNNGGNLPIVPLELRELDINVVESKTILEYCLENMKSSLRQHVLLGLIPYFHQKWKKNYASILNRMINKKEKEVFQALLLRIYPNAVVTDIIQEKEGKKLIQKAYPFIVQQEIVKNKSYLKIEEVLSTMYPISNYPIKLDLYKPYYLPSKTFTGEENARMMDVTIQEVSGDERFYVTIDFEKKTVRKDEGVTSMCVTFTIGHSNEEKSVFRYSSSLSEKNIDEWMKEVENAMSELLEKAKK